MPDDTPTEIRVGDCIDEMREMDADSVHAVVTDPPYGMAFMPGVNDWDSFDSPLDYQEWCKEWASEALRVLKPGGHLIAFSGTRTYGFLMCGVHAANFEIRDTITWHYGQGFGAGKTQDVTNWMDDEADAEKWEGFKIGLKPATELAVLARKPLEGPTYKNVLEYGTGALNVDGTRVPTEDDADLTGGGAMTPTQNEGYTRPWMEDEEHRQNKVEECRARQKKAEENGRYPSNLCIDPTAAVMLDEQSGEGGGGELTRHSDVSVDETRHNTHEGHDRPNNSAYSGNQPDGIRAYGDGGGASRFFYCAKASPNERSINEQVENDHSTVKPLELMEWLVTLVTAEGQRVLDPFTGSGTTLMACKRLGREGLGIEMDDEHAETARKRVELAHELETDFNTPEPEPDETDDTDGPATLESFGDD